MEKNKKYKKDQKKWDKKKKEEKSRDKASSEEYKFQDNLNNATDEGEKKWVFARAKNRYVRVDAFPTLTLIDCC